MKMVVEVDLEFGLLYVFYVAIMENYFNFLCCAVSGEVRFCLISNKVFRGGGIKDIKINKIG